MIKEATKREIKDLVEGSFCAIIEDLNFHDNRFYQIHDTFYMENGLRFASAYIPCLIE